MSESFLKPNSSVLDVGSGAGFPSIPLAIVRPDLNFLLIDSLKKRVDFLNSVAAELSLKNVKAEHIRIEDLNKTNKFDYSLARAVAPLRILSEYCLPFIKTGGQFISYKSEKTEEEIKEAQNALKTLNGKITNIFKYQLTINEETFNRTLVIINKTNETSPKYPRKGNKPRLEPL